ncbi:TIR domain-containing protein [Archangium gephyra]|nr:TIR domain-containing protein [Archangium gephyra]
MSESKANTLTKELAALDKKMADLRKKEGELSRKQAQVSVAIASAKSSSMLSTKTRELDRVLKDLAGVHDKLSSTLKRRADKESELARVRDAIQSTREKELKRIASFEAKQRKEQLEKERAFQRQMSEMRAANPTTHGAPPAEAEKRHDFFISHASEDKQDVARPLYEALTKLGCSVWYDEFSLKVGDSLRRSIEKGIVGSRYGVIIVSERFLAKEWPARELDALTAIEIAGEKKVLPIWHRVTKDFVLLKAPMLADKLALNTATKTIPEIASELKGLLE